MKFWLVLILILSISLSAFTQDDSNADLDAQLDQALMELQEPGEVLEDVPETSEQDPSIGGKDDGLFDRMLKKMRSRFSQQLKKNPLRFMTAKEVETLILERTQGNIVGDYLKNSPRAMYFIVNFMRDEFALPQMMQILDKEKELKRYSYFVIGNIIFFFLLGWYYDKTSNTGLLRTIFRKIFLGLLSTSISFAVFYVMFHKEVQPTVGIAKEAMMKPIASNNSLSQEE